MHIEEQRIANPEIAITSHRNTYSFMCALCTAVCAGARLMITDSTYRAVVHNSSIAKGNVHTHRITIRSKMLQQNRVPLSLPPLVHLTARAKLRPDATRDVDKAFQDE